jgi:hypothetical protein
MTLKVGDHVRFTGSRSNRFDGRRYREILELVVKSDSVESVSYDNSDYVAWDPKEKFKYGAEAYGESYEAYLSETTEHQRKPVLFLVEPCPKVSIISKNVPHGPYDVVVATNSSLYLKEVEVDGMWTPIRDILKSRSWGSDV